MPKKRFTDEQVAFAPRQAEAGSSVGEIWRKMGVAEATFYRWKTVYAGMGVSEIWRLKQLEEANSKLKRLVADHALPRSLGQPDGSCVHETAPASAGSTAAEREASVGLRIVRCRTECLYHPSGIRRGLTANASWTR
jgi:putative transposase